MNSKSPGKRQKTRYDDDLFSFSDGSSSGPKEPLADRMRPRNFDEFVGQEHIVGHGRLLRRAIETGRLTSIILHGPPGTGKTTIANIIAHETHSEFFTLNAVLDGVKELREVVAAAESRAKNVKSQLFVDEIHRWNKAQQEALLPHIESGTIVLVGATTENPFFSLVGPLISRSRVFRLEPLTQADIRKVLLQAIADPERGYGGLDLHLTHDAPSHWIDRAHGGPPNPLQAPGLALFANPP